MIVDAWGQHPTLRHAQHSMFESLRRWTRTPVPTEPLPVRTTLALMDAAGVDLMMISAWQGPGFDLIRNEEVADFVAESAGRLVGVGSVDIGRPAEVFSEVRRCVEEFDFRGIRVLPWLAQLPPTDRRFYPLYAACCEFGLPWCTQIGHTGPLMPSEVGRPLYLDQVALDFPELVIVAGHIGYPWTEEAVAVATKHQNIYIDTSAYVPSRYPAEIVRYLSGHGRDRVMYGSNYPMLTPLQSLQGLDQLGLEADVRSAFLGETASRVFGLTTNQP